MKLAVRRPASRTQRARMPKPLRSEPGLAMRILKDAGFSVEDFIRLR